MSSVCRFINNSKGSGDYCVVTFDGEIIHQGHNLSFHAMFELFKYYGGQADIVEYEEVTDEELEEYL